MKKRTPRESRRRYCLTVKKTFFSIQCLYVNKTTLNYFPLGPPPTHRPPQRALPCSQTFFGRVKTNKNYFHTLKMMPSDDRPEHDSNHIFRGCKKEKRKKNLNELKTRANDIREGSEWLNMRWVGKLHSFLKRLGLKRRIGDDDKWEKKGEKERKNNMRMLERSFMKMFRWYF